MLKIFSIKTTMKLYKISPI